MTAARYAFIKANWHAEIVDRALDGFRNHNILLLAVPAFFVLLFLLGAHLCDL